MKKFYNVPIVVEFKPKLSAVDKLISGEGVDSEPEIELFTKNKYMRLDDVMSFYFLGRNDKGNDTGLDVTIVCSESMGILWIVLPLENVVKMIQESMDCELINN